MTHTLDLYGHTFELRGSKGGAPMLYYLPEEGIEWAIGKFHNTPDATHVA